MPTWPPRVLVVESEPLAWASMAEALDGLGDLATAASPEVALQAAEANPEAPPAVLVTHTDSPKGGLGGLALAGEARRRWPDLGVVYVTGQPSGLDGQVLGARDRFVPQPASPEALVRAVRTLLTAPLRPAP
jgi:CheY-like chemotaxis protein